MPSQPKGVFGAPATVEQAPAYNCCTPSARATRPQGRPVGTWFRNNIPERMQQTGVCSCTGYPLRSAPRSATLLTGQVRTTARQCGANHGPTPPLGIVSPQAACCVQPGSSAAPRAASWKGWIAVAAVIVGLWILAGWSFRRYV